MAHDTRAVAAANNNADLYEAMFAAWGLRYKRTPFAFVGTDSPPPYYSNLTVLSDDCVDEVLACLRAAARRFDGAVAFKDSFCEFDLQANGFDALFAASWIWRPAQLVLAAPGWSTVDHPAELEKWEAAWKRSGSPTPARMFRDAMLENPDVAFLGKLESGDVVAGCIANRSTECIGISNLFSVSPEAAVVDDATAAVASIDPRLPIVGYAAGPRLNLALDAGYETTGELRILATRSAQF